MERKHRKRVKQSMLTAALLCALASVLVAGTACEPGTYLRILPRQTTVTTGETFTLDIIVEPAPSHAVAGVQFDLSFDSTLLQVENVAAGTFLAGSCNSTFFRAGTIDNDTGTVSAVVDVVTDPGCAVSAAGTLATVTFTAEETAGTCQLRLTNTRVGNVAGDSLYSVPYTAIVEVVSP